MTRALSQLLLAKFKNNPGRSQMPTGRKIVPAGAPNDMAAIVSRGSMTVRNSKPRSGERGEQQLQQNDEGLLVHLRGCFGLHHILHLFFRHVLLVGFLGVCLHDRDHFLLVVTANHETASLIA